VNRKAAVIASSVVAVLIAAAVVLSVVFLVVLPTNGSSDSAPGDLPSDSPRPAVKRLQSSGNVTKNNWAMTFDDDAPIASIRQEMEDANMPWLITSSDNTQKTMTMVCDESIVPQALAMKGIARYGRYIEEEVTWTTTQATQVWGLDRTDQRNLPLSGTYSSGNYNGAGVDVHVLDTGVLASHSDFGGRVGAGYDAVRDGNPTTSDCQGHGTHVSGTIGGATYGLAKGTNIYASRVLGCDGSGSTTGIINAIKYVANLPAGRRRVINMSLGGGSSTLLDQAVADATSKGVVVVVAAGNENQDACNVSPARAPSAITVVASDRSDVRASFSNYGTCTDIIAPGVNIVSASNLGGTQTKTMSGTSMASPHVAGVAALVLQAFPNYTPQQVRDYLVNTGTPNKITSLPTGTPNVLLYWAPPTGTTPTTTTTSTPPASTAAPTPTGTTYTGTLANGGTAYVPQNSYYTSTTAGQHIGVLTGPAGTDFDLYLYRYTNGGWVVVDKSEGTASTERVAYTSGSTGTQYYLWAVRSYSGAGSFTLTYSKPQ